MTSRVQTGASGNVFNEVPKFRLCKTSLSKKKKSKDGNYVICNNYNICVLLSLGNSELF